MSYYEVEVERIKIRKGTMWVKANQPDTARRRAEAALGWDDGRIVWEGETTDDRIVSEVHKSGLPADVGMVIGG